MTVWPIDDVVLAEHHRPVTLVGEVDIASTWDLPQRVRAALDGPGNLIEVDASRVTFIDACGVSVLMVLRARLRAEGHDLVLRRTSPAVRWMLQLLDLTEELGPGLAASS